MNHRKSISRKKFLSTCGKIGTAAMLAPLATSAGGIQPEKKIKVGVIGCGSVSNMYLPHLSKSPYVELVATCDIIPERAKKAAQTYKIANAYPHIDQMLAGSKFDLLVNLTDMQEHGRLNKIALNAGRHIWSEKPMANTYQEGSALLDLAKQKKLALLLHMSGCIGDFAMVSFFYQHHNKEVYTYDDAFAAKTYFYARN